MEFMRYPLTVKGLAEEIKHIGNSYMAREINDKELTEIICWYADQCPEKLFLDDDINPTIRKIIGKRRVHLIHSILDNRTEARG